MDILKSIAEHLLKEDGFTIITHESPDGDTLGSSLALFHALRKLNKSAEVVCCDPVPKNYLFLPGIEEVRLPQDAKRYPNVIAVDCADKLRMGCAGIFFKDAKSSVNIDHHGTNDHYAELNDVSPECAATGERMYHLLALLIGELDTTIATCLYTALMTDTGNFSYSNTTPDTLHTAAELLAYHVDHATLNRKIYRSSPFYKVKLQGKAIANMELFCEGKLAVTVLTQADMESCGATSEDTEGIVDIVRDIDTVEVAMFFKESSKGGYRVSLRSKEYVDVSVIAMAEGGGGHVHAAGCSIKDDFEKGYQRLLSAAKEALSK